MRILTVKQPWATAIISLGKDVENRTRNIAGDYRGPVAIHAGLKEEPVGGSAGRRIRDLTGYLPLFSTRAGLGAIIGVVDLVDVHQHDGRRECHRSADVIGWVRYDGRDWIEDGLATCSQWGDPDVHHLVLANPRPLQRPIPYKGALGLRTLDPETVALIAKQVQL